MKILVVEDEPSLREGLRDLLDGAGHQTLTADDGDAGLAAAVDPSIELVVLDLMLPRVDGIEVCRRLRRARPRLPILVLTARGSEDQKVSGLRAGADDYVTKPFGTRELLARIEALARRAIEPRDGPTQIATDGCRIDLGRCLATRDGSAAVQLTARETEILRRLYVHRTRAVTRAELLETVWGARGDLQTRTVDMTIANLRQKIERDPASPRIVVTVKGVGYAWGES
ncbi:MAG TPA: response regulator transcription factor [Candidatus Polarisedimenticolaceae bacterium]|nr:response regulator transcription factor [Candidatus Polarisedimenticolaceae bacterium]